MIDTPSESSPSRGAGAQILFVRHGLARVMRAHLGLAFVLAVLWNFVGGVMVSAQDFSNEESLDVDDRVSSILNAPAPSDHTGLLGKIYLQQRYDYLKVNDPDIRQLDKAIQGTDTFLNLPAVTLDLPTPLDFDVFFGYSNLGMKGSTSIGPPIDTTIGINAKSENFAVGTTIYPTLTDGFRPFVQVGANFTRSDMDFYIGSDPMSRFAGNFVDHSTKFLLNVGFEADILDYLGYRMTLDLETKDRFKDSMLMNDLILWPHDKIFVRGGLATSLDGGGIGFTVGGGLAF